MILTIFEIEGERLHHFTETESVKDADSDVIATYGNTVYFIAQVLVSNRNSLLFLD